MKENIILDKSFDLALSIVSLYQVLQRHHETVPSKQLLRSGTSIGANVEESTAAQSRRDFITKMSIASKEARESRYWLCLLQRSQSVKMDYSPYMNEINEVINILTAIVKTSQKNP
jgi:four helix bundle protein